MLTFGSELVPVVPDDAQLLISILSVGSDEDGQLLLSAFVLEKDPGSVRLSSNLEIMFDVPEVVAEFVTESVDSELLFAS